MMPSGGFGAEDWYPGLGPADDIAKSLTSLTRVSEPGSSRSGGGPKMTPSRADSEPMIGWGYLGLGPADEIAKSLTSLL